MQKESRLKVHMLSFLARLPNSWFTKVQQVTINGTPDIIGCIHGVFIALELKSSSKADLTPLQEFNMNKIDKADGVAIVVHPDNFFEVTQRLKNIAINGG